MGAKTTVLAYVEGSAKEALRSRPQLDRSLTAQTARQLFPSERLQPMGDVTLESSYPPDDEINIGCFPGLTIVAAREFGIDYPSRLARSFLEFANGRTISLHAMHSVVDWFAFAIWREGKLVRSLSLSPDSGILEDEGTRQEFELPFWSGQYPVGEPGEEVAYPFPFHPLELGEAALLELFGYQIEGLIRPDQVMPEDVPLMRFKRGKAWWKLW
jgi:hypothetical protein